MRETQAAAFAELKASADLVLRHPYVEQSLGHIATQLQKINDGAFLPNISGGVISIPLEQQDTDNVAVVPLVYQKVRPKFYLPAEYKRLDGAYFLDQSACRPTSKMGRLVTERLLRDEWEPEEAASFLDVSLRHPTDYITAELPSPGGAYMTNVFEVEPDSATRITSRPIVFTNFVPGQYSALERGVIMGHEYVHALDFEASCMAPEDPMVEHAINELRAYHLEAEMRLALRAAGLMPYDQQCEERAFEVEYLRREHADLDNPYPAHPELVGALEAINIFGR